MRGNWPLVPTMDVVVPHTRSVADMLELLDVIVADDPETRGDFWRAQPWVRAAAELRRAAATLYRSDARTAALQGKRLGVPACISAATAEAGPSRSRPAPRCSPCGSRPRAISRRLGAEVVEVDFPVVSNYERDRPGAHTMVERGLVPKDFAEREIWDLCIWSWDDFLRANADPTSRSRLGRWHRRSSRSRRARCPTAMKTASTCGVCRAREARRHALRRTSRTLEDGLKGLEATRRARLRGLAGRARAGRRGASRPSPMSARPMPMSTRRPPTSPGATAPGSPTAIWSWRHLGIPTVTVPMGTMADIGMPVGLTFAGKAYDDARLLRLAGDFERADPAPHQPAAHA